MSRYYLAKYATFDDQYIIFDSEKIDGLYKSFKVNEKTIEVSWENRWNGIYHHKTYDIVKQAEKIEDLFDCIVYDCLPRPHQSAYHKHEIGDVESLKWNKKPERFENIYGAIWCEWGLKYVAKMNDKGELELL